VFVKPEEKDLFRQFRHDDLAELQPSGPLEHELAAAVIHAAWNLRRIRTLEAGLDIPAQARAFSTSASTRVM
jgi:hypothetical protein